MSLRARIMVWFALAITVVIFALLFTAQHVMVARLRADLDERLQLRSEMVTTAISSAHSDPTRSYAQAIQQLTEQQLVTIPLFIRVTDLQGNTVAKFGSIPASIVPTLDRQLSLPGIDEGQFASIKVREGEEGKFASVKAKEVETLRVYTMQARDPSTLEAFAVIQTGESLAPVTAAENRLWQYTIIEGVIGSLFALSVGLVILRRSFRPLDRILDRVQHIRAANLTAGLPAEPRPPELQRLADSLNVMWHQLNAVLRAKESFVASVSHELRTPLTAIQGQIDVLLMRPSTEPEVRERLERTAKEVRRLVRMTNNLLLNAQLDSKPVLTLQQVNLRELVEEVVRELQILAEGLDLNLRVGEDVVIYGDYDLLKQAVLNVVDNAIKFTPRGGHVQLNLEHDEGWAIIEVSDSGQGISREHLPHVMEPFYKAVSSQRPSGGAGLGLAIVKQVIELHRGKIQIDSQEGGGTKVKMYLPIRLPSDSGNNHPTE
jgi:two-component system OmpR family sensor kinase